MKHLLYISIFLITAFSFGQNTGLVVGKVLDKEMNDAPLVLANVSIKGTSIKSETDLTGLFVIENLEAGDYTLVCSFVGYESQEMNIHVDSMNPAEVKLSLAASSISLDDLALVMASADSDTKTSSAQ
ncbi:carboxypeptidase-like regulatory domain-containing protein [Thalassobellus sediminis]|uniref:carboxypeptidase-like regulatory domain-containing protein n=1 Tax=Thalassobellus sediminis TaxID=3367753 RepID=UPI00379C5EE5